MLRASDFVHNIFVISDSELYTFVFLDTYLIVVPVSVAEEVLKLAQEKYPEVKSLSLKTVLKDELRADIDRFMDFLTAAEELFDVEFIPEEFVPLKTIQDLVNLLKTKVKDKVVSDSDSSEEDFEDEDEF